MASKHHRFNATRMTANYVTPDQDLADMGAYRIVTVQRAALKTQASTAQVAIQHNSTKDPDRWVDTNALFKLDGTDAEFVEIVSFSRYVRVKAPSAADGTAVFQFDLIGKE